MQRYFILLAMLAFLPNMQAQAKLTPDAVLAEHQTYSATANALADRMASIRCLENDSPQINVEFIDAEDIVNDRMVMPEIALLSENTISHAVDIDHSSHMPAGLSVANFVLDSNYHTKSIDTPRRGSCAHISDVTLKIGYTDSTIYVARELPRRSCPYKEVLAHERKHKQVDAELMAEYKPIFEKAARDIVANIGHVRAGSRSDAEDQIAEALNSHMKKLADAFTAERIKRQAAIDTAEEYARVTASCDGRLLNVLEARYGEDWVTTIKERVGMLARKSGLSMPSADDNAAEEQ